MATKATTWVPYREWGNKLPYPLTPEQERVLDTILSRTIPSKIEVEPPEEGWD